MPSPHPYAGGGFRPRSLVTLAIVAIVYYVGFGLLTPELAPSVEARFPDNAGLRLFLQHVFTFSLPTAVTCMALWVILAQVGTVEAPHFVSGPDFVRHLGMGVIAGTALALLTLGLGSSFEQQIEFHPNGWRIAGNAFSNFYEELVYRGLLLHAFWAATGSRIGAIVLSSVVFGWSHGGGPNGEAKMVAAAIAGCLFAILAVRTRSLLAPWAAHQVADTILDSL